MKAVQIKKTIPLVSETDYAQKFAEIKEKEIKAEKEVQIHDPCMYGHIYCYQVEKCPYNLKTFRNRHKQG